MKKVSKFDSSNPENQRKTASLNGTVRKECLNLNWFYNLDEVNELLGQWYKTYNFDRPHSSLQYQTPATFENLNQSLYFKLDTANGG